MTVLNELAERDLSITLEAHGQAVTLIAPDGEVIDTTTGGGSLTGQVYMETLKANPETGEPMVVHHPVLVLRRSSLSRIPAAGEKWIVKTAADPGGSVQDFIVDATRPPEGSRSIGFIKLYLRRTKQS